MTRTAILCLAALVLLLAPSGARSAEIWKSCPGLDVEEFKSERNAPADHQHFVGFYRGKWANQVDHVLIVDSISANGSVTAFSAWGRFPKWGFEEPRCWQTSGVLRNGVLSLAIPHGGESRYALSETGWTAGEFQYGNVVKIGVFQRFDPENTKSEAPFQPPEKLLFPSGYLSELAETRRVENGRPDRLHLITIKPDGPGPFPVLVFNHGSTGGPDRDVTAREVHVHYPVVRFFLMKGWMVVSPHRRGRGWSDGLHDEGLVADRSRYSCDPKVAFDGLRDAVSDLEAAMSVLRSRAEVDTSRIIIGGHSRSGGLSMAYADKYPKTVRGIINAAGGWHGSHHCASAFTINKRVAAAAAHSQRPTLWLYGGRDISIGVNHGKAMFDLFKAEGGTGTFAEIPDVGHGFLWDNREWIRSVADFMVELGFVEFAE